MTNFMTHDELVDLVRKVLLAKNLAKERGLEASEEKARWRRYKELEGKLDKYAMSPATAPWKEREYYNT